VDGLEQERALVNGAEVLALGYEEEWDESDLPEDAEFTFVRWKKLEEQELTAGAAATVRLTCNTSHCPSVAVNPSITLLASGECERVTP